MRAYKIVHRTNEKEIYASIGFIKLEYRLNKETTAPGDSLLFVYDSLRSALKYTFDIGLFSKYYAVFEVETSKLEKLDWMIYPGDYDNPKQIITDFWKDKASHCGIWKETPKGTLGTKSLCLVKEVGKTKLRLVNLFVRIFG